MNIFFELVIWGLVPALAVLPVTYLYSTSKTSKKNKKNSYVRTVSLLVAAIVANGIAWYLAQLFIPLSAIILIIAMSVVFWKINQMPPLRSVVASLEYLAIATFFGGFFLYLLFHSA